MQVKEDFYPDVVKYICDNKLTQLKVDPWSTNPLREFYYELTEGLNAKETLIKNLNGWFVVLFQSGHYGSGGMHEGSPPSVRIIKLPVSQYDKLPTDSLNSP